MKVFIVEDSEIMRGHLQSMLSDMPGVELVGYAEDELGAIKHMVHRHIHFDFYQTKLISNLPQ